MKRASFTLIELLTVIAIIAILASLLMPALSRARAAAQKIKCVSNIKQVGTLATVYAADYRGRLPILPLDNNIAEWSDTGSSKSNARMIELGMTDKLACPLLETVVWNNDASAIDIGYCYNGPRRGANKPTSYSPSKMSDTTSLNASDDAVKMQFVLLVEEHNPGNPGPHNGGATYYMLDGSAATHERNQLCNEPTHGIPSGYGLINVPEAACFACQNNE